MPSEPLRSDTSPTDDVATIQASESAPLHTEGEERNEGSEITSVEPDQPTEDSVVDESSAPSVPQALGTDPEDDEPWPEGPEGETRAPPTYPSATKPGLTVKQGTSLKPRPRP